MVTNAITITTKALEYYDLGFTPIPINQDRESKYFKSPKIKFQKWSDNRPSREEVKSAFDKFPDSGIANLTGPCTNLTVIDSDPEKNGIESGIETLKKKG